MGDVIGFSLKWDGQQHGELWITGDTVLYDDVRRVPSRLTIGTMLLHLGDVHFGITGPVHYTFTADEAVELCDLVHPRTIIPVHYEGWSHFKEGRVEIERALEATSERVRQGVRWATLGKAIEIDV